MFKRFLLTLLLLTVSLFAADARLNDYPKASEWEQAAEAGDADAMYNLAHTYQTKVKDFDKAIYWYKRAYEEDKGSDAASNLGYVYDSLKQYEKAVVWYKRAVEQNDKVAAFNLAKLYKDRFDDNDNAINYYKFAANKGEADAALNLAILYRDDSKNYDQAIAWYKKAYEMGNMGGANGLGYLCELTLHDDICAEEWYLKAAKGNEHNAIGNLAEFYHKKGDNIKGAAYAIALIDNGYTKNGVFDILKNDWKLDRYTLQKAYELQQTLDLPKHYTGGID